MPSYKGVPAVVEPASSGEKVQSLEELLETYYEK
jgi:formylmethanofuran dehydrogenase subunit D